jgi:phosphopantetheinyl transferase
MGKKLMSFLNRAQSLTLPHFEDALFWVIDLQDLQPKEVEEAMAFLDDECKAKAVKFLFPEDSSRHILVHAILRIYLEKYTKRKPAILRGSFGKPYLKDRPIHFNISHKKKYAFIGFHPHHPIGVDIEENGLFAEDFLNEWCAKEAFSKAKGTGLSSALRLTRIASHGYLSEGRTIQVYDELVPSHKLAVCLY